MDNDWTTWNSTPDQTWYTSGSPEQLHYVPSNLQAPHAQVRKTAKWNHFEHKAFIETCELVIAEGHRRGKCFSMKGWHRVAEMFNASTGKDWTTTQMKNYWNKLRMEHKHLFELLRCTGIEYRPGTGRIHAPDHWWESKIKYLQENPKYAKYRNFDCSEIYDTYGKLFGDTGDSTKYALSPTKLLQRGFDLNTDSDREDGGDKFPINAERTDSSGSPVEGQTNSAMNISGHRSGDKRKGKHRKGKGKKKMYGAREVSASLERLASVGTDLASIARSHHKGEMFCRRGMCRKVIGSTSSPYGSYGTKKIESRTVLPRHLLADLSSSSTVTSGTVCQVTVMGESSVLMCVPSTIFLASYS